MAAKLTAEQGACPAIRWPKPEAWEPTRFGKPPISMTFHHVIPYALLKNCWNSMARNFKVNGKAKVSLQIYMQLIGIDRERGKSLLKAMDEGILGRDAQELIAKSITYAPWNIVEGPKNRSDDPGHSFDEYRVGLTGTELNRHRKLKVLNSALLIYNDAVGELDIRAEEPFVNIANELSPMIGNTKSENRYIRFRESMWKAVEGTGSGDMIKWRKRSS